MMHVNLDKEVVQQICQAFIDKMSPKFYNTRGGAIAVVLHESTGESWDKLLGAYYNTIDMEGDWIPCKWGADGTFGSINENVQHSPLDLIMKPAETKDGA